MLRKKVQTSFVISFLIASLLLFSLMVFSDLGIRSIQAQDDSFTFIAWSDTRNHTAILETLSDQVDRLDPDFTIFSGDLEYSGFTPAGMNAWKNAMNGDLSGATSNGIFKITFPVRGNHDGLNPGGWQNYYDMASIADRVGATNYTYLVRDLTYSFDYGNSHFIGVDLLGEASFLTTEKINWIDLDLTTAEARGLTHAFLYFHGPIYCVDGHCTCTQRVCLPTNPTIGNLIQVLNRHPIVSAIFHGHEHTLAYIHIDDSRIPEAIHEYEQFVAGSAGQGPNPCIENRTDYCLPAHGFLSIDVDGDNFTVKFFRRGNTSPQRSFFFFKEKPSPTASNTWTPTETRTPTPTHKATLTPTATHTSIPPSFSTSTFPSPKSLYTLFITLVLDHGKLEH